MNRNLLNIYILIMLECRLSLEDASKLFRIDAEELRQKITDKKLFNEDINQAIEYLIHESIYYDGENKRGLFKAQIYLRRLDKIRKTKDKEERKELLNALANDLSGPDIRFALSKNSPYNPEEKEKILKYHLKYAVSSAFLYKEGYINKTYLQNWENELPEGELKSRLRILREFLKSKYFAYLHHKKH